MESMSKPLRRLQEEGAWFARAKETRLLWVKADGSSRRPALAFVEKLELSSSLPSMCSPLTVISLTSPDSRWPRKSEYFISLGSWGLPPKRLKIASSTNIAIASVSRFLYRWFNSPPAKPSLGSPCAKSAICLAI